VLLHIAFWRTSAQRRMIVECRHVRCIALPHPRMCDAETRMILASRKQPSHRSHSTLLCAFLAVLLALASASPLAGAQQDQSEPHEEIVADLAAGRVIVAVLKDAIFVASIEDRIEPGTRPPAIVPLESRRVGIVMGAVEWSSPSAKVELARLDQELPRLRGHDPAAAAPHLQGRDDTEAKDLEVVGNGLFERLNEVVREIHGNLNMSESEPLTELILADYIENYGPEVWILQYPIKQEPQRGDFWDTKVLRPRYSQLWPPEKGQPHTLLELTYPVDDKSPSLLARLRQNGPPIAQILSSDPKMATVAEGLLNGESQKLLAADAVPFLRSCLSALTPQGARQTMALVNKEAGFAWVMAPPPEPTKPGQQKQRPPGAPTLIKPPS
jgi:hypothetical protein